MIGFFIFDELPSVSSPMVLSHSALNNELKGYFYVRQTDCVDVSSVKIGDEFFGILDDSSGFGACLFIKGLDVDSNAMKVMHDLHVLGNTTVLGSETVTGNITSSANITASGAITAAGTITGAHIIGTTLANITLTQAHCAAIIAGTATGAELPEVPIVMA